jgi:hypothetical protein
MTIVSEKIEGKKILVEIKSSNIKSALFDTETENLLVTFNNGSIYEYNKVPWEIFTKFRMSESQGAYLNSTIKKNYQYIKIA